MPNTYTRIHIQTIFAVKYRDALIDKKWKHSILEVMGNLINDAGCQSLIINGVEDHIHCFFELKPTVQISELMKTVKAKSSKFINDNKLVGNRFEWQRGYSAFSYSQSQIDQVYRYVSNQEEHHKMVDFKTEHRDLLIKNLIEYDEKYFFEDLI